MVSIDRLAHDLLSSIGSQFLKTSFGMHVLKKVNGVSEE